MTVLLTLASSFRNQTKEDQGIANATSLAMKTPRLAGRVPVNEEYCQSERNSAKAQSDISACGKIPSRATARPLADISTLTSSGAAIGRELVG
ncbi:MAG: hypothetical protein CAPSK01_001536 [Candidatus Accumulibacter vicinus]|uniref:Uncharacterized protein n=1 Tax=Candidatus Accumulibacter vicinus TaxID=2954382 RepID=A0A084Y1T8_9PROT|nr:MAG: hypothetical protein CAPSK01_001536 [Candidatus Accumulibacter vicinus]